MKEVVRRDENGDRIAVIHSYAPGDGLLSFVAQDPQTHKIVQPPPTREECQAALREGWELFEDGLYYRARKKPAANLDASPEDHLKAIEIALRAHELVSTYPKQDIAMDLLATHLNGCPLDLQGLLDSDQFELLHDVLGIKRHLDRSTGKLAEFFTPRYSAKGVE